MSNIVFIASSLDGYIADKDGGLDWLELIPNPNGDDLGYNTLMSRVDALIMGKNTFEAVLGFGIDWPYSKPVFVLSNTLKMIPADLIDQVEIIRGPLADIIDDLGKKGFNNLYIDGGKTIQSFLKEDLIDEIIVTTIPILLGGGAPLFSELLEKIELEHIKTEVFLNEIVQSHYKVKH